MSSTFLLFRVHVKDLLGQSISKSLLFSIRNGIISRTYFDNLGDKVRQDLVLLDLCCIIRNLLNHLLSLV